MFNRMYDKIAERAAAKLYCRYSEAVLKPQKPKKQSLIKGVFQNPDDFVLTMWTEDDEIRIKLKKKETLDDGRRFEPPHARVRNEETNSEETGDC
ncbi:MAG: hypothetical protein J6U54_13325 [Clostridiales bacterium]|nr:hypothetical protein [Clostridiales bacterium]